MSVLSNVFSTKVTNGWAERDNEEVISKHHRELSRLGYDPRKVKSYRDKMSEAHSDDERILLAAQMAHSRSNGRHLGQSITVECPPWQDDGYDYPARGARAWLMENGEKNGVILRPTK